MAKDNLKYEQYYYDLGYDIIGIDEVGRGPICGPIVICGISMEKDYYNEEITDSKKLSEKKRDRLFKEIIKHSTYYDIQIVSSIDVDKYNVYQATKRAMQKISDDFNGFSLVDAMPLDNDHHLPIIKGDLLSFSIACASIVAKVIRDHIMYGYDVLYPMYELKKHKGYPTKKHIALIEEFGVQDFYRFSYGPVQKFKKD
ncbi:MAG: ribonuclease HII [Erysipelotrichaceae bacterium]